MAGSTIVVLQSTQLWASLQAVATADLRFWSLHSLQALLSLFEQDNGIVIALGVSFAALAVMLVLLILLTI